MAEGRKGHPGESQEERQEILTNMAQATQRSRLKTWATWVDYLMLILLPLLLQGLIVAGRYSQSPPHATGSALADAIIWWLTLLLNLFPLVGLHYVAILSIVLTVVYCIKLIGAISVPSWRSPGRIVSLLLGLLIFVCPLALSRAGVCVYEFHRASNDELFSRAITAGIKNGSLDPAITTVDEYYQQHDKKTCCKVFNAAGGIPSLVDLYSEIVVDRMLDVSIAGDTKENRFRVGMCHHSRWSATTAK